MANEFLYRGIQNRFHFSYFSLYLSIIFPRLSCISLSETVQATVFKHVISMENE